nr:Apoptosis inhibitory 5 domain containing protein [Haemonchus contortus]
MFLDVALLYDMCLRLEENHDPADFQLCIDAIKDQDVSVKKLAIQIVIRFFDDFPDKGAVALNTLMSQLKDPDIEVQKLVIKVLPSTCSLHQDYVDQVGDVLAQLLSISDKQESLLVRKSLYSILVKYPKATVLAIYKAVTKAESNEDKLIMLQFMDEKVVRIHGELTPFMKELIAEVYRKMLVSSTPEEVEVILRFIAKSRQITEHEKQTTFRAAMDCLVEEGVKLDQRKDIVDCYELNKIVKNVVKIVLILHSVDRSYIMPAKMTDYLFSKFDKLHRIHSSDRKDIMKVLSGITYLGNYEDSHNHSNVIALFDFLKDMLPVPSVSGAILDSDYVKEDSKNEWDIEFSELELVSIVVYNILQRSPAIAEKLLSMSDVWKPRFQYLVNVIRVYTRCLKKKLDNEADSEEKDNAMNIKLLRAANNVGLIANCFLVNICDLHVKILPSWIVRKRRVVSQRDGFNPKRRRQKR